MLDAVYVDAKEEKRIVAIKPKPPFRAVFQVATTREGSGVMMLNEPPESSPGGSCVFLVEPGESRTPPETRGDSLHMAVV